MSESNRDIYLNEHVTELTRGCFTPLFFKTETVEKLREVADHYDSTYQHIVEQLADTLYQKIHSKEGP
jgi:hypothetical protein